MVEHPPRPGAPPATTASPPHPAASVHDAADGAEAGVAPGDLRLDEALKETFPASDPISPGQVGADLPPPQATPAPPPSDAPIPFPTSPADDDTQPAGTAVARPA